MSLDKAIEHGKVMEDIIRGKIKCGLLGFLVGLGAGIIIMCIVQVNKDDEDLIDLMEENIELGRENIAHKDLCKAKDAIIKQLEEQVETYKKMLIADNYDHIPRID
jgi:hypothetical protein